MQLHLLLLEVLGHQLLGDLQLVLQWRRRQRWLPVRPGHLLLAIVLVIGINLLLLLIVIAICGSGCRRMRNTLHCHAITLLAEAVLNVKRRC